MPTQILLGNQVTTELLLRPRELRLDELSFLTSYGTFVGESIRLERSPKNYRLKTPITVETTKVLNLKQTDLVQYVLDTFLSTGPKLLPFVLENESLIQMARHLLRVRSGSQQTLYHTVNTVLMYSTRVGATPDQLIADVKPTGLPNPLRIEKHRKFLATCLEEMQEQGRAPGRISGYQKQIRMFYNVNAVELPRIPLRKPNPIYEDASPSVEDILRMLDYATLREKFVISVLCLSGMREGTLVRLKYGHIKRDYEAKNPIIHVHVNEDITKGKYAPYDAFFSHEAEYYCRQYIEARKKGGLLHPHMGPEQIDDDSPLIRDELNDRVRGLNRMKPQPIGEKQLYKLVHSAIARAGLLRPIKPGHLHYTLRPHTLRKVYAVNMEYARMPMSLIQYTMGHVTDTYHQVQSKGVEYMRNEYAKAGFSLRPKTPQTRLEILENFAQSLGFDTSKVKAAFSEPHRIVAISEPSEEKLYAEYILAKLKELSNS
ncbi:MAG TPA: site-specific integrase [Candidatus Bathyarchaeia archaeon]|nr:site-specific integrase [Candidatus Bathyarchaeia archaeon]